MNLRAHDLAVQFYKMARGKKLPFGLQGQLQRASSSVALNLAEGWGRATPADRRRFFQMALGSVREVQSIVSLEPEVFDARECDALDHLAASVYKLTRNCPGP
jgi:four helix bundle protein